MKRVKVAIIGSGNIGMDLMYKVLRNEHLEMSLLVGLSGDSPRLKIARELGVDVSDRGIQAIIDNPESCDIVFDATTATAHKEHAPVLKRLGKVAIDMTPAGVGVSVVPAFNMQENLDKDNINLISCSAQAVIPIIGTINRIAQVVYAEAVTANASVGVGPGTRANIDEFTHHTQDGIMQVAGVPKAKSIIVINPAEPPIKMHNTVFCELERLDSETERALTDAIAAIIAEIQSYIPGYVMSTPPQYDYERRLVTVMVEVEGAGDYLPAYAGNLDIITQAGVRIAAAIAQKR